jgi:capsular polysaccharide biosynthesis protein
MDTVAYREAALSQGIIGRALNSLGSDASKEAITQFRARASVSVTAGSKAISDIYTLRYNDPDPTRASKLVNAWAKSFLQWDSNFVQRKISRYITDLEAQYRSLNAAARQLNNVQVTEEERAQFRAARGNVFKDIQLFRGLRSSAQGSLIILDAADTPNTPIAPRPRRNAVVAAFVTFVALTGLWLLYFVWATTQRNPQAFELDL